MKPTLYEGPVTLLTTELAAKKPESSKLSWQQAVANYQHSDRRRSVWQAVNSLVPYFILWFLMVRSLEVSYWLTLVLSIIAAGFLMRIFIIFHDCGHGSFFESRRANDALGILTGILTFTPYYQWRHDHAVHHASAGDLDRRGVGDVWTLTVQEYLESSPWKRVGYRLFRYPMIMFGLGPFFAFVISQRFARGGTGKRERYSFHHIHHLSPRIPNYYLESCYRENPIFQEVKPITILSSLKSLTLRLWDEERRELVGFGYLKTVLLE